MERRSTTRTVTTYDRKRMTRKQLAAQHPIDAEIRDRLRRAGPHQEELAARLGRSTGWLNKYMNGAGHATIDDVIRIGAILIGVDAPRLTEMERRVLRGLRRLPAERQQDVLLYLEKVAGRRRGGSSARAERIPRATNNKEPGTR